MDYDIIIVGGSFSGLLCAYFLAKQGLKVCLFERKKSIEASTKSTGILTKNVMEDLRVPHELIEREIQGFYLYSPKMAEYEFRFNKPLFFQSDTLNFLKWLKELVENEGVEIREGVNVSKFSFTEQKAECEGHSSELIVFASGIRPNFASGEKPTYYSGVEYLVEGVKVKNENMWQVYFDHEITPGYASWVAKSRGSLCHVGVLRKVDGNATSSDAMKMFIGKLGLKIKKIIETRAGVVPLSGPFKKTYGNRFILVGDAAGQVGAFYSAGINYAAHVGKIVGDIVPKIINDPSENNLSNYERLWKADIGKNLSEELKIRRFYDKVLNNNKKYELALKLFDEVPKKKVIEMMERYSNLEQMRPGKLLLPFLLKFLKISKQS